MTHKHVTAYGRTAVGQRVEVRELKPPPGETVLRSSTAISLTRTGTVADIWTCDSGAQVEVRLDAGGIATMCVNTYGQQHGGFGALVVLRDAPVQREMLA
jgi:hypothetical protein